MTGSKWVYKVKRNADGSVERFKARLVAQGYSESEGIGYEEVFAPVAGDNSVRSLLTVGTVCDWEIHQMDVKSASLGPVQDFVCVSFTPDNLNCFMMN